MLDERRADRQGKGWTAYIALCPWFGMRRLRVDFEVHDTEGGLWIVTAMVE